MTSDPDYPKIMLSFDYRGFKVEIARDRFAEQEIYMAWVNHQYGYAMAVPYAVTTRVAIKKAKKWVDKRIDY